MTVSVFAVGDSVMQGAGPDVYATLPAVLPGIEVDASPSRQLAAAPSIVTARVQRSSPPDVWVVHLGTNGLFAHAMFDELIGAAGPEATVLVLTIKAPREWEHEVNRRLTSGAKRAADPVRLVDWWALATARPDYLRPDGFHLSELGARAYAETIASEVARL